MVVRCPESGKATGRMEIPPRRIRCVVCDQLIRLRLSPNQQHIIVPAHNMKRMGPYSVETVLKRALGR